MPRIYWYWGGSGNCCKLGKISGIIIVGSSCTGKSTFVNYIRGSNLYKNNKIAIPKRYITREKRQNDDCVENIHISQDAFLEHVRKGVINIHWSRDLGRSQYEKYGFEKKSGFSIYSANNAILQDNCNLSPKNLLSNSLVIALFVPDEERINRMRNRSPDFFTKKYTNELEIRMKDSSKNILSHADIVVNNYKYSPEIIKTEFLLLIEDILNYGS